MHLGKITRQGEENFHYPIGLGNKHYFGRKSQLKAFKAIPSYPKN